MGVGSTKSVLNQDFLKKCNQRGKRQLHSLAIVKQPAVPQRVVATATAVEETRVTAVKLIQAILDIFAGVAVNDVKKNTNAVAMGCVNEKLEIFRGTIAAKTEKEKECLKCHKIGEICAILKAV